MLAGDVNRSKMNYYWKISGLYFEQGDWKRHANYVVLQGRLAMDTIFVKLHPTIRLKLLPNSCKFVTTAVNLYMKLFPELVKNSIDKLR
ncbi:hypothetical protein GW17_00002534 [Ensete ventricosum]|nr:hypothetical protein GW17_00002534 [Ensete ventricosum]